MSSQSHRPKILVARRIFPEGIERLKEFCEIDYVDQDPPLSKEELRHRLLDKDGALVTGSERIDMAAIENATSLKIISNIAVGFNNFDVDAFNQRGIIGTNTPDVLTDTTADLGFALLMAISRRLSESERWLRDGQWHHWGNGTYVRGRYPSFHFRHHGHGSYWPSNS
jgi:gluconate 2-dehydrogenase